MMTGDSADEEGLQTHRLKRIRTEDLPLAKRPPLADLNRKVSLYLHSVSYTHLTLPTIYSV